MIFPNTIVKFFGDRTEPGGNDYALSSAIKKSKYKNQITNVKTWRDTWKVLLLEEYERL